MCWICVYHEIARRVVESEGGIGRLSMGVFQWESALVLV